MVKRAVEMEGTVTGEHGVGMIKRDYLAHELGESTVDAMRRVCDSRCLLELIPVANIVNTYSDETSVRSFVSAQL